MSGYVIQEGKRSHGAPTYNIMRPAGVIVATIYGSERKAQILLDLYNQEQAPPMTPAEQNLGSWLSAALSDPAVCAEMKADIEAWMKEREQGREMTARCNLIPIHHWEDIPGSFRRSVSDRDLESGSQRCLFCTSVRGISRKREPTT